MHVRLGATQIQIVEHLIQGRSVPEIADDLCLAHATVRWHIAKARRLTGARTVAALTAWRVEHRDCCS